MKKIMVLLTLALLSVCVLTACGEKEDAFALYTEMKTAMETPTSMQGESEATLSVAIDELAKEMEGGVEELEAYMAEEADNLTFELDGETAKWTMFQKIRINVRSKTDFEFSYTQTNPQEKDDAIYYKDGWTYMDYGEDARYKKDSPDELTTQIKRPPFYPLSFDEDAVTKSAVKTVEGGRELRFTLNGEKLYDELTNMVSGDVQGMLSYGVNPVRSFGDVSYTVLLDGENRILRQHIVIESMEIETGESYFTEEERQRFTAGYEIRATFGYYISEIEYPADLDEYREIGNEE